MVVVLPVVQENLVELVILDHKVPRDHLVTVVKSVLKANLVQLDLKAPKDQR